MDVFVCVREHIMFPMSQERGREVNSFARTRMHMGTSQGLVLATRASQGIRDCVGSNRRHDPL